MREHANNEGGVVNITFKLDLDSSMITFFLGGNKYLEKRKKTANIIKTNCFTRCSSMCHPKKLTTIFLGVSSIKELNS